MTSLQPARSPAIQYFRNCTGQKACCTQEQLAEGPTSPMVLGRKPARYIEYWRVRRIRNLNQSAFSTLSRAVIRCGCRVPEGGAGRRTDPPASRPRNEFESQCKNTMASHPHAARHPSVRTATLKSDRWWGELYFSLGIFWKGWIPFFWLRDFRVVTCQGR